MKILKIKKMVGLIILNFIFIFAILTFWMPYYCAYKMTPVVRPGGNNSDEIETIQAPIIVAGMPSFHGPQTYKDIDSGTVFFVESDGRHVSAINTDGKILWHRDPFVEGRLEPYRSARPVIVYIGKANQWMLKHNTNVIAITFDSTQFGTLDIKTGDFVWMGQD